MLGGRDGRYTRIESAAFCRSSFFLDMRGMQIRILEKQRNTKLSYIERGISVKRTGASLLKKDSMNIPFGQKSQRFTGFIPC
jgi:hypothetical protein